MSVEVLQTSKTLCRREKINLCRRRFFQIFPSQKKAWKKFKKGLTGWKKSVIIIIENKGSDQRRKELRND